MKKPIYIFVLIILLSLTSCSDNKSPNHQFMPNMYEPVGYNTYGEASVFPNDQSALVPVEGTIARGWQPYDYENSIEGKLKATNELKNPLEVTTENLKSGQELYGYFCAVCHGDKGDGKGILAEREKFLGIPSYADPGRVITEGSIYHVQMYGINAMGDYTAQTNEKERWQITMHVENLKSALEGKPLKNISIQETNESSEVEMNRNESDSEALEN